MAIFAPGETSTILGKLRLLGSCLFLRCLYVLPCCWMDIVISCCEQPRPPCHAPAPHPRPAQQTLFAVF